MTAGRCTTLALLVLWSAACSAPPPVTAVPVCEPVPSPRQLAWHTQELTAFVRVPSSLFSGEVPGTLDCGQWVRTCRDAGMTGLVLLAKDSDGYCLWPSATTTHTIAKSTWRDGKGDLVREVAQACRAHGLAFGVALSVGDRDCAFRSDQKLHDEFYVRQQRELSTGYGPLLGFWIEPGAGEPSLAKSTKHDWPRYCRTVREVQPDAVIASELGPDVRTSDEALESAWSPANLRGRPGAFAIEAATASERAHWIPIAVRAALRREGAEHSSRDEKTRPLEDLVELWERSVGNNTALVIEVPIDEHGLVPDADARRLRELRAAFEFTIGPPLARVTATDSPLEIRFAVPTEVDRVVLSEPIALGQRVRAFTVEAEVDGAWRAITRGTTVGSKRSVRFDRLKCTALRVTVTDARSTPTPLTASAHLGMRGWRELAALSAITPR